MFFFVYFLRNMFIMTRLFVSSRSTYANIQYLLVYISGLQYVQISQKSIPRKWKIIHLYCYTIFKCYHDTYWHTVNYERRSIYYCSIFCAGVFNFKFVNNFYIFFSSGTNWCATGAEGLLHSMLSLPRLNSSERVIKWPLMNSR